MCVIIIVLLSHYWCSTIPSYNVSRNSLWGKVNKLNKLHCAIDTDGRCDTRPSLITEIYYKDEAVPLFKMHLTICVKCGMGRWLFWSWFYVCLNQSTFDEDMCEKTISTFSFHWPWLL